MATGRNMQLTKQVGEYLVAAELCFRGLLATTFTGNVSEYDIVASDGTGKTWHFQVKTIRGGAWQFSIDRFAKVRFAGKRQIIGKPYSFPMSGILCVFVVLSEKNPPRYFILTLRQLQSLLIRNYKAYLKRHKGRRPKKFQSLHSSLKPTEISTYENNWKLITKTLK